MTTRQGSVPLDSGDNLKFSNRPSDAKFKQQKLPAWQPMLTAPTVITLLFSVALSFIPLGIAFLVVTLAVKEKVIDYTDCNNSNGFKCADVISKDIMSNCSCNVSFSLTDDFPAPVYMYYSLKNFYQSHRRYVKSRDDTQLLGSNIAAVSGDCSPYTNSPSGKMYAPCGAIANSLFNDTYQIFYKDKPSPITLLGDNIAWETDMSSKYNNPSDFVNSTEIGEVFNKTVAPSNWRKSVYDLDPKNTANNGYKNQDLIVWMRTAAFPTFRKLYRRIAHKGFFEHGLKAGNYEAVIEYNYPVMVFNGEKRIILTTTSFLGGKNFFLGIAYLVVGGLSFLVAVAFLIIHWRINRALPDELIALSKTLFFRLESRNQDFLKKKCTLYSIHYHNLIKRQVL